MPPTRVRFLAEKSDDKRCGSDISGLIGSGKFWHTTSLKFWDHRKFPASVKSHKRSANVITFLADSSVGAHPNASWKTRRLSLISCNGSCWLDLIKLTISTTFPASKDRSLLEGSCRLNNTSLK